MLRLECNFLAAASRALHDTIVPTTGHDVLTAVVRISEGQRSLLKGLGIGCHTSIVRRVLGIVKYIFTAGTALSPFGVPGTVGTA
jgi:hypothetical protein